MLITVYYNRAFRSLLSGKERLRVKEMKTFVIHVGTVLRNAFCHMASCRFILRLTSGQVSCHYHTHTHTHTQMGTCRYNYTCTYRKILFRNLTCWAIPRQMLRRNIVQMLKGYRFVITGMLKIISDQIML
jgi:hypothetical protein